MSVARSATGRMSPSGRVKYASTLNAIKSGTQKRPPARRNLSVDQRPQVQNSKNVLSLSVSART